MRRVLRADPRRPFEHVVRGIYGLPDGSTRILGQTGGPYDTFALLTLDSGGRFEPDSLRISAEGTVEGLEYAVSRVEGLHVLSDGSTLVGGSFTEGDGHQSQIPGVLRLDADGTRDPSFADAGVAGAVSLSAGAPEVCNGLAQDADGGVSVVATRETSDSDSDSDWVIYRLAPQP